MKIILTLFVLSTLTVFLTGCNTVSQNDDAQNSDKMEQEQSTDAPETVSADLDTFTSKSGDFSFNYPKSWELKEETGLEGESAFSVNWKKLSKVMLDQATNLFIGELSDSKITLKDYSKKVFEYYISQADPAADLGFEENQADDRSYLTVFVQDLATGEYYMEVYTSPNDDTETVVMVSATGATKEEAMSAAYSVYQYIYPGDNLAPFIQ